ncbi:hypothetical protein B0H16DRAFT_211449 [Mycena metata]|uniref:Uncharacterized protein n=1 Tax=Mycena metata TaxID=1033252 RepID=A0AAD7NQ32_9AGAR|nr:hypothetical protein B0H16DRAFT_211449 [Mycena metata]
MRGHSAVFQHLLTHSQHTSLKPSMLPTLGTCRTTRPTLGTSRTTAADGRNAGGWVGDDARVRTGIGCKVCIRTHFFLPPTPSHTGYSPHCALHVRASTLVGAELVGERGGGAYLRLCFFYPSLISPLVPRPRAPPLSCPTLSFPSYPPPSRHRRTPPLHTLVPCPYRHRRTLARTPCCRIYACHVCAPVSAPPFPRPPHPRSPPSYRHHTPRAVESSADCTNSHSAVAQHMFMCMMRARRVPARRAAGSACARAEFAHAVPHLPPSLLSSLILATPFPSVPFRSLLRVRTAR